MPTIEGIGDEVVHFFIGLGIVFICLLLWLTTRVRNADEPFFRTVYVLERRYRRTNVTNEGTRIQSITDQGAEGDHVGDPLPVEASNSQSTVTIKQTTSNDNANFQNGDQTDAAVSGPCGEESVLRRRMAFFKAGSHNTSTSSDNAAARNSRPDDENVDNQSEANNIKVRLKYLNDDLRIVDGRLHERLLDFKKRNFPTELTANKLIRLIFNGRALRDDNLSLQNYGFFDNCVVHCVIQNERSQSPPNSDSQEQSQQFSANNEQTTSPEWNLSKLLCFIIVAILSLAWYCRFQFAALFTFTSTSFLLGLTVVFFCSVFGRLYVDSVPINSVG
ncbi:transmembrane and ubiquitin-like domain-containing protein 1 [Planococcus citri]|uniref:transmembrane and ubiquitin-like domain-containing protein 1 n=1 Tax=Planococcus citri TaxID=170843 RepID=UPI0031F80A8C